MEVTLTVRSDAPETLKPRACEVSDAMIDAGFRLLRARFSRSAESAIDLTFEKTPEAQ